MFNSVFLVKNYITHDSAEKSPPIRESQQADPFKITVAAYSHEALVNYLNLCST